MSLSASKSIGLYSLYQPIILPSLVVTRASNVNESYSPPSTPKHFLEYTVAWFFISKNSSPDKIRAFLVRLLFPLPPQRYRKMFCYYWWYRCQWWSLLFLSCTEITFLALSRPFDFRFDENKAVSKNVAMGKWGGALF